MGFKKLIWIHLLIALFSCIRLAYFPGYFEDCYILLIFRDAEDHISWLLQHGWHEKALAAVEAGQGRSELLDEVLLFCDSFCLFVSHYILQVIGGLHLFVCSHDLISKNVGVTLLCFGFLFFHGQSVL